MLARSAFDVLMSNASKMKSPSAWQSPKPKQSSPRKRKSAAESQNPNLLPPNPEPITVNAENSSSCQIPTNDGLEKTGLKQIWSNNADVDNELVALKKPKVSISPDGSAAELKKKAVDFKVKRAAYWAEGERVPFLFLAKALHAISMLD